jgi:oxygen-independent coproporphyrinogen III oxidase
MLALSEKKYICKVMNADVVNPLLVRKYNRPLPRYTSYPTIPFWKEKLDIADWQKCFTEKFAEQNHVNGISLYIHLPFCETLCTYCGCNKKITTNHKVEEEYLEVIEKEWNLYRKLMKQVPVVREIHLGGGTPTFFSPKNLKRLLETIFKTSILHPKHEFSIEGHPNNTTLEHLTILHKLGFKRISYGVQDNDPEVQRIINRIQPLQNVKNATENARKVGFTSVNYDLIYGLPKQTLATIERTIKQIIELKPDRIAFYSYAHVPWTSKGQRLFDEKDLPAAEEKINLYLKGKQLLTEAGYFDIGMDHFALPHDELYKARLNGKLHRNFMGYTTQGSGMVLGLGVSAISDTGNAFAQNEKTLHDYYAAISKGVLAIKKGYELNEEDIAFKNYILNITCRSSTNFQAEHLATLKKYTFPNLQELTDDGLIEWDEKGLRLTDQGHYFIRVVCAAFDLHLLRQGYNEKQVFSKAI